MMPFQQKCGRDKVYVPGVFHPLRIGIRIVNTRSPLLGALVRTGIHGRIAQETSWKQSAVHIRA
jgi:hypothetical protein